MYNYPRHSPDYQGLQIGLPIPSGTVFCPPMYSLASELPCFVRQISFRPASCFRRIVILNLLEEKLMAGQSLILPSHVARLCPPLNFYIGVFFLDVETQRHLFRSGWRRSRAALPSVILYNVLSPFGIGGTRARCAKYLFHPAFWRGSKDS